MSEFSLSRTEKYSGLPSFLLSDFFHLCFFVLSHPLYFSYFIFFSPYLFKIFSFLSPLFITTILLLVALLSTVSPSFVQDDSSEPELGSLAAMYRTVSERLRSKADGNEEDDNEEEFRRFEEFEVYKVVFDTSAFETREDPFEALEEVVKETCLEASEAPVDKCLIHEDNAAVFSKEGSDENSAENPVEISHDHRHDEKELFEKPMVGIAVDSLKWCLQEERELENMSCKKEDKEDTEVKPWIVESEKVDHQDQDKKQEVLLTRSGSKVIGSRIKSLSRASSQEYFASPDRHFDHQYSWKSSMDQDSQTFDSSLGSFGSMRKEKEWRRTLACKLFEERHNVDGGEGMDLLWETYETSESKKVQSSRSNSKKGKKGSVEYSDMDDDDDYEDEAEGQLCCLQALKFSAGKMNLGMGRPNLVKISKALKGIGWITNVGRHGKKRYH
ncbi:hypothetical protein L484_007008 [Morus notabilis]|uniref:Uncharacterized protein n=1 Tax=Morus notabilis TaxID=981085 RepID=W9SCE2_9ROSA|nr:uncharacterized protein LOC21390422 [Morus notabilis]EXB99101.1 hypothetical protein L484_007008 [Morus notabilis]